MKPFVSLINHSDMSLMQSLVHPDDLVTKAVEFNQPSVALVDKNTLAGCMEFLNACAAQEKNGHHIKPILGCQLNINPNPEIKEKSNRECSNVILLSKNLEGWKNLVKANNLAQKNFYFSPRTSLEEIAANPGHLICIGGHIWSSISNAIFNDHRAAYAANSFDEAKSHICSDWYKKTVALINQHIDIFGRDNFFLSIQRFDVENQPAMEVVSRALRHIAKREKIKVVGTGESRYLNREAARDFHIVLCKLLKTTIPKVQSDMAAGKDVPMGQFFRSMNYHPLTNEMANEIYTEEEIENTNVIADMVEKYSLAGPPSLPIFDIPSGLTDEDYLAELCREGWKKKVQGIIPKSKQAEYSERIKSELKVLNDAGIARYFLIVQDVVNWMKSQGWLTGFGRGSAAGCLTSYLLNITGLDPIQYGLLFERFYSAGRVSKDKISLPDVDLDIEPDKRELAIQYMRDKYREDNVVQVSTFGRLMGRNCIKEVLRVHNGCSFAETNRITEFIPDQSKISDDLQEMENEGRESSIIRWSLENNSKQLKEWCYLDGDEFKGPMAKYFQQGIRLEGVRINQGVHAAALLAMPPELTEIIPKSYNKKDKDHMICNWDMHGAEKAGALKIDFLGISALTTIKGVSDLLMED